VTEQLKNVELETLRVAEERDETVKMTADKMDEMEQQTKEGHTTLKEHKADYSNADEALAEAKKQQEVTTRVLSCSLFADFSPF
jgi:septation ring formation regulator EzrA